MRYTLAIAHVFTSPRSWHFLVCGPLFLGVGSGLLYTVNTTSSSAKVAGFQILVGVGTGMGVQNTLLAIQWDHLSIGYVYSQQLIHP